ncbi:MAG TPA: hypothetical protein VKI61_09305 [Chitinophagaceae bacterium]|jgi:hypothetical protein|nr:hypothetical protein [Chitinophagaceae bacterium]
MKLYFICLFISIVIFPAALIAGGGKLFAGTARINITPESDEPLHDSVYAGSLGLLHFKKQVNNKLLYHNKNDNTRAG